MEKKNIIAYIFIAALACLLFLLQVSIVSAEWIIYLLAIAAIAGLLYKSNKISMHIFATIMSAFIVISFSLSFFLYPAISLARGQGTVLSDNWWQSLNWIKQNTEECAVVATYWDPGHFITGIAERPVVCDGASQNSILVVEENGKNITRSRIQDIATTLLTDNETLAVDILKRYKMPGCSEMYYIASSDLISKSQWWTYFSTWNPVTFGNKYYYFMSPLSQARPLLSENAITYIYPAGQQQSFIVYEQNNSYKAFLQQGGQMLKIEKIVFFTQDGMVMQSEENASVKGLVWLDPSRQMMIFIPPELENSMFTRMYFFNGFGLENFEFVSNWGGEVKLFRVKGV